MLPKITLTEIPMSQVMYDHYTRLFPFSPRRQIDQDLVDQVEAVRKAEVCLVSRIGTPIDEPPTVWLGIEAGKPVAGLTSALNDVVRTSLKGLPGIWEQLIESPAAYW